MNTATLERYLHSIIDSQRCFVAGVFPRDLIPTEFDSYPACLIANTDPSIEAGQHWVSYFFQSISDYEFFDSYGFPTSLYSFSHSSPISYNSHSL